MIQVASDPQHRPSPRRFAGIVAVFALLGPPFGALTFMLLLLGASLVSGGQGDAGIARLIAGTLLLGVVFALALSYLVGGFRRWFWAFALPFGMRATAGYRCAFACVWGWCAGFSEPRRPDAQTGRHRQSVQPSPASRHNSMRAPSWPCAAACRHRAKARWRSAGTPWPYK
jgi:hypothetical protein